MTITYKQELITPAQAQVMLKFNEHNRKKKPGKIARYAATMLRDEWQFNGESIKMNGKNLLDGQNRLEACIKSDTSFSVLVVRGLPLSVQKTIDTGCIRTGGDHFQMQGEMYADLLSQTVMKYIGYLHGKAQYNDGVTNVYLEKTLDDNPEMREIVNHYGKLNQKILPKSVAACCHYIFSLIDTQDADAFMAEVIDGLGLEMETPTLKLREKMIRDLTADRKIPIAVKYALVIKAWNFYRKDMPCKSLGFRNLGAKPEPFPKAI